MCVCDSLLCREEWNNAAERSHRVPVQRHDLIVEACGSERFNLVRFGLVWGFDSLSMWPPKGTRVMQSRLRLPSKECSNTYQISTTPMLGERLCQGFCGFLSGIFVNYFKAHVGNGKVYQIGFV